MSGFQANLKVFGPRDRIIAAGGACFATLSLSLDSQRHPRLAASR